MMHIGRSERRDIIAALREGHSQNSTAKSFGRSPSTVNRIAKEAGLAYSAPENANAARRAYAKEARLDLSDMLFGKLRQMVEECDDSRSFKELAIVFGILVDKRLLEEGEATHRVEERVMASGAKERLARLLASVND